MQLYKYNTLSVILITCNSEKYLKNCLRSIYWADEIIILDFNSHDNTCSIAQRAGAKVFHSDSWFGFGIQRQKAQSYATSDYVLFIDADERITDSLKKEIKKILIKKFNKNMVYSIKRKNFFLGKNIKYGSWNPDLVIRMFPRKYYFYNSSIVHEKLNIKNAKIIKLKGELLHFTCLNLSDFLNKQLKYSFLWANERYSKKSRYNNIFIILLKSLFSFFKSFILNLGFLDGKYGLLLAFIIAQYTFNKYSILWDMNLSEKK